MIKSHVYVFSVGVFAFISFFSKEHNVYLRSISWTKTINMNKNVIIALILISLQKIHRQHQQILKSLPTLGTLKSSLIHRNALNAKISLNLFDFRLPRMTGP